MGVNVGVSLHVQAKRRVGQCCGVNGIAVAAVSGWLQAGSNRYRGLGLGGGIGRRICADFGRRICADLTTCLFSDS